MRWSTGLRAVALLRRIAKALEAANDLACERLALDHPEWGRAEGLRKTSKLVDIGTASVADWNAEWRRTHPEEP
ncbi:MAG: hypothetical protein ABH877_03410 [bacterium]